MKKIFALVLALTMVMAMAACTPATTETNNTTAATTAATTEATTEATAEATEATEEDITAGLEGTLEALLYSIIEKAPVEFMGGAMTLDLTDTSEDGLWMLNSYTGLENADSINEAAFFEPMMGSLPYSMVMVRVNEGVDVKTVAEAMKSGINPRKWICVEADDLQVVSVGNIVMLIMVGSETGLTSQTYVDAFGAVCTEQGITGELIVY